MSGLWCTRSANFFAHPREKRGASSDSALDSRFRGNERFVVHAFSKFLRSPPRKRGSSSDSALDSRFRGNERFVVHAFSKFLRSPPRKRGSSTDVLQMVDFFRRQLAQC